MNSSITNGTCWCNCFVQKWPWFSETIYSNIRQNSRLYICRNVSLMITNFSCAQEEIIVLSSKVFWKSANRDLKFETNFDGKKEFIESDDKFSFLRSRRDKGDTDLEPSATKALNLLLLLTSEGSLITKWSRFDLSQFCRSLSSSSNAQLSTKVAENKEQQKTWLMKISAFDKEFSRFVMDFTVENIVTDTGCVILSALLLLLP